MKEQPIQEIQDYVVHKFKNSSLVNPINIPYSIKTQLTLEYYKRSDVLFKIILRQLRRVYIKSFQRKSTYLSMAKYRPPQYFMSCINDFIGREFSDTLQTFKNTQNQVEFLFELKFILGAILAPKRMMMIYEDAFICDLIKRLVKTTDLFSRRRLVIISEFNSFRFLVYHFILKYKDYCMSKSSIMMNAKHDFEKGITFL